MPEDTTKEAVAIAVLQANYVSLSEKIDNLERKEDVNIELLIFSSNALASSARFDRRVFRE